MYFISISIGFFCDSFFLFHALIYKLIRRSAEQFYSLSIKSGFFLLDSMTLCRCFSKEAKNKLGVHTMCFSSVFVGFIPVKYPPTTCHCSFPHYIFSLFAQLLPLFIYIRNVCFIYICFVKIVISFVAIYEYFFV